jgi:hypothetical protein
MLKINLKNKKYILIHFQEKIVSKTTSTTISKTLLDK